MGCFGEIMEPSSRALWDNLESDEEDDSVSRFSWADHCPNTPPPEEEPLLVFEGAVASEFAKASLIVGGPALAGLPPGGLTLHRSAGSTPALFVLCPGDVESAGGLLASQLKTWLLQATQVIVVKSLPLTVYRGTTATDAEYLVRALHTPQTGSLPPKSPVLLERPNIVGGLAAGVLSICAHVNKAASLHIVYCGAPLPGLGLDSTLARPFIDLMHVLDVPLSRPFISTTKTSSNLYL